MTDDQGYGDLSLHGNPILKTPNLDKLGRESVRLTNYHVAPTCAPTRAGLLTGRWNNRTGVWHTIMGRSMLRDNEKTLADLLQANGYKTGLVGKWHLGDNYPYRPHDRGFDVAIYHGAGGLGQTPDHWNNAYFDDVLINNGHKKQREGFITDVLFDDALSFIAKSQEERRPFFLYLSTNAPHGPMHAPDEYAALYKDQGLSVKTQHFYGMIANLDDNIKRLRDFLTERELADNTILIFTTDNGTSAGDKVFNAGMRGKKNSEYDGGHRVPFFIHWPEGKLHHGKQIKDITSMVDIVPTILELTQSQNTYNVIFDGLSLKPLLTRTQPQHWPERIIFTDSQRVLNPIKWRKSAVMTNKWRLINGVELYNMEDDPAQTNNVASLHGNLVKKLRVAYEHWWQDVSENFTQPAQIAIGSPKANPVLLTSHDWLGNNEKVPWNQQHIRQALREEDGVHKGYWAINVVNSGRYKFSMRRWPEETDTPIRSALVAGDNSTGQRAFREQKGIPFDAISAHLNIAGYQLIKPVSKMDKSIEFDLELEKGSWDLNAFFTNKKQQQLGSYYVHITGPVPPAIKMEH